MKLYWLVVIILALIITGTRSYYAFSVEGFSDDTAYARLRDAQHILTTGHPLIEDPLVPRPKILLNAFEYILASITIFLPLETTAKLLPNILAGILFILYFTLALRLSGAPLPALLATTLFSILPDFYAHTFNSASPLPAALIFLTILYLCILSKERMSLTALYLATLVMYTYTHPSIILFITGLGLTLILKLTQHIPLTKTEQDSLLLSTFFVLTTYLIVYRIPLLTFGLSFLSTTIPQELFKQTFEDLTPLTVIAHLGAPTIIFALIITYKTLSTTHNTPLLYPIGLSGTAALLTWTKLIPAQLGMLFFAYPTFLLFGTGYAQFSAYLSKTKAAPLTPIIHASIILFIILIALFQLNTTITQRLTLAPNHNEKSAALWLHTNIPKNQTILTPPNRAQFLAYHTQHPIIMDTAYYLFPHANQTHTNIARFYTTTIEIEAVNLAEQYTTSYAYLPPHHPPPPYAPGKCFSIAYYNLATIYAKSTDCQVKQT